MKNKLLFFAFLIVILTVALCGCKQATSISFTEDVYYVKEGETFTPDVRVKPKKFDYTLTAVNDTIVSVDGKSVTGLKNGAVTEIIAVSGDKKATATVVVTDLEGINSISYNIKKWYNVSYVISNYSLLGLESGVFASETYYEGASVSYPLPAYSGYISDGWFKDQACEQTFDPETDKVSGDLTLYCRVTQLDNTFQSDGTYITGILFSNLEHSELTFPREVNGREMKGIAKNAFKGDTKLKSVKIPATYEYIGDFAFAGCTELTTFEIEEGSALKEIGQFAFSVTESTEEDEETGEVTISANEDACKELTRLSLPDGVEEIGDFAFAYCEKLELDGIPSSLTEINKGVFYKTKINSVDLANITKISSFSFADCTELTIVRNTQRVTECETSAFVGSKTYNAQIGASPYVAYIDTILVGCNKYFGRGMTGNGKITLDDRVTLIGDKAFYGDNQTELTIYVGNGDLLFGEDVFRDSEGVCIAVPDEYLVKYKTDNPLYRSHFCVVREAVVDGDPEETNFGKHTLLKFTESNGDYYYYYDKFSVLQWEGNYRSPRILDLSALYCEGEGNVGRFIKRINTRAINLGENGGRLETLYVGCDERVKIKIAALAVINCKKLTRIDFTNAAKVVEIEQNSFQFTSVGTSENKCYIYVLPGDIDTYKNVWTESVGVAYERLRS